VRLSLVQRIALDGYERRADTRLENQLADESAAKGVLREVKLELSKFLATQEWDYFLTVTSAVSRSPDGAVGFLRQVATAVQDSFPADRMYLCTERHQSGFLHVHGLYKTAGFSVPRATWLWERLVRFGRSKVEIPRGTDAVSRYCAKYVAKSGGEWFEAGPGRADLPAREKYVGDPLWPARRSAPGPGGDRRVGGWRVSAPVEPVTVSRPHSTL